MPSSEPSPEPSPVATPPVPPVAEVAPAPAAAPIETKNTDIVLPADKSSQQTDMPLANAPGNPNDDAPRLSLGNDTRGSTSQMLDNAQALAETGDNEAAAEVFDRVMAVDRDNHAAMAGKALALARMKKFEAAVTLSHRLLKFYPQDTAAQLSLVVMLGQWDSPKALDELERMLAVNPENATAHMALGKQYERRGNFQQAIMELDTAAHQVPNDLSYRLDLAILYDHAGYASRALELYREILEAYFGGNQTTSVPIDTQNIERRIDYLAGLTEGAKKAIPAQH